MRIFERWRQWGESRSRQARAWWIALQLWAMYHAGRPEFREYLLWRVRGARR